MTEKTDRELLEAAAMAAGMVVLPHDKPWPRDAVGWFWCENGRNGSGMYGANSLGYWNPLTDDGDALRLSVKLALEIRPGTWAITAAGNGAWAEVLRGGNDDAAATRRAIVRAAAAMGEP